MGLTGHTRSDLYDFIDKVSIWNQEVSAVEAEEFHRRDIEIDVYPVDGEFQLEKVIGTGIDSITATAAHTVIPQLEARGLR